MKMWECKTCGRFSVAHKEKCGCGQPKPQYQMEVPAGRYATKGEPAEEIETTQKEQQQKDWDKKQRKIAKHLLPPDAGSFLQSCMKPRKTTTDEEA